MTRIKQIIFFLALSIVINWLSITLQSTSFVEFLKLKLIELLITMLAINTATASVIVSRLHDIQKQENISLRNTIKEVKISLLEQISLIAVSCLLNILYSSPILKGLFKYQDLFFSTLYVAVFIYAIDILRDTGNAIFSILKYMDKKDQKPN